LEIGNKIPEEDLIKIYGDEITNRQNETNRNISELRGQFKTAVWINGFMGVVALLFLTAIIVLLLQQV